MGRSLSEIREDLKREAAFLLDTYRLFGTSLLEAEAQKGYADDLENQLKEATTSAADSGAPGVSFVSRLPRPILLDLLGRAPGIVFRVVILKRGKEPFLHLYRVPGVWGSVEYLHYRGRFYMERRGGH